MNQYFKHLTPIQIYTNDVNRNFQTTKSYSENYFTPCFKLGIGSNVKAFGFAAEFERCDYRRSAKYSGYNSNNTLVSIEEKIKLINSKIKLIGYYSPNFSWLPAFLKNKVVTGISLDIGLIRNKRKQSGDGFTNKWELFYYNQGLSKPKGSDFTFGTTLFLGYRIGKHLSINYQRQLMWLDASFDGYAGKKSIMNSQYNHYGITFYF